jgi:hypothetical protein
MAKRLFEKLSSGAAVEKTNARLIRLNLRCFQACAAQGLAIKYRLQYL